MTVTDARADGPYPGIMGADLPLFKTPSLENHLLATATHALDGALAALNAQGRISQDPGSFAVLAAELGSRLRIGDAPTIDEAALTFENHDNRRVEVHLPITGAFDLLSYQVRGMPPPALQGTLRIEPERQRLAIAYDIKPGPTPWDAGLDGDLAMLRAYVGALGQAVAHFNQHLGSLVEAKIRDTIQYNEVRREIGEKMARRGFREIVPGEDEPAG